MPVDGMAEQIGGDVFAAILGRKGIALIDDAANRDVAALEVAVRDVGDIAECELVAEGAVLVELLPIIASLNAVQHDVAAEIRAVKEVAELIEVESPRVAAAVAEQLKFVGDGMVAPDALLEGDAVDLGGDRASLAAVEPAVGPPGERVGYRMGVLHAEALEQHARIPVGYVFAHTLGIEEKVRRLQDEDAAVPECDTAGEVKVLDEILRSPGPAVAVYVFEDGNTVGPFGTLRRRFGHAVIDGARVAIDLEPLQPGGIRILQVLHDPEP